MSVMSEPSWLPLSHGAGAERTWMQPWLDLWIFDAVNGISKGHAGISASGSLP